MPHGNSLKAHDAGINAITAGTQGMCMTWQCNRVCLSEQTQQPYLACSLIARELAKEGGALQFAVRPKVVLEDAQSVGRLCLFGGQLLIKH